MTWKVPRPTGLKPTLRQGMIVIVWSAILFAILRSLTRWKVIGSGVESDCGLIPFLATILVPLLPILILLLDRPGPVRHWYQSCCVAMSHLGIGSLFLLQDPVCFLRTGHRLTVVPFGLFLSIPYFWIGVRDMRRAWPGTCPHCERRTVIASSGIRRQRLLETTYRAQNGWCASCGLTFERRRSKAWEPKPIEPPSPRRVPPSDASKPGQPSNQG